MGLLEPLQEQTLYAIMLWVAKIRWILLYSTLGKKLRSGFKWHLILANFLGKLPWQYTGLDMEVKFKAVADIGSKRTIYIMLGERILWVVDRFDGTYTTSENEDRINGYQTTMEGIIPWQYTGLDMSKWSLRDCEDWVNMAWALGELKHYPSLELD
jgi:hypothetical protein